MMTALNFCQLKVEQEQLCELPGGQGCELTFFTKAVAYHNVSH